MYRRNQFFKYSVFFKDGESDDSEKGGGDNSAEKIAGLESQIERMREKGEVLLAETKKAKDEKTDAAEKQRIARESKALEDGDLKSLLKSSEERYESLKTDHDGLKKSVSTGEIKRTAMTLAYKIADGNNADLLREFISKRLRYDDGTVKVTDENGNLTVSSIDDLMREFENNPKYNGLLKGNQSSGGGASGGKNSDSVASKKIERSEWDALDHQQRKDFALNGGEVI